MGSFCSSLSSFLAIFFLLRNGMEHAIDEIYKLTHNCTITFHHAYIALSLFGMEMVKLKEVGAYTKEVLELVDKKCQALFGLSLTDLRNAFSHQNYQINFSLRATDDFDYIIRVGNDKKPITIQQHHIAVWTIRDYNSTTKSPSVDKVKDYGIADFMGSAVALLIYIRFLTS